MIETARVTVDPDLDDDKHCAMCSRRANIFVLEKHHIWPVGWGGPSTVAASARGKVWVYADGNCHNTVHLILDHMKRVGEWDDSFMEHWQFPFGPGRFANIGWKRYMEYFDKRSGK